jgi:hypothetical protein
VEKDASGMADITLSCGFGCSSVDGCQGHCEQPASARSRKDVAMVAQSIRDLPDASAPAFAARLLTDNLMRAGWFMRSCHAVLRWRTGVSTFEAWAALFGRNLRGEWHVSRNSLDFREQAAKWCESGKDASDRSSVGGWNQGELDRVTHLLATLSPTTPGKDRV